MQHPPITVALAALLSLAAAVFADPDAPTPPPESTTPAAPMRSFTTTHYVLKTDTSDDIAREAFIRMDRMFDEYAIRTAAFARPPAMRFPFYMFTDPMVYYAAGGIPRTAGVFMVRAGQPKLMAIANDENIKSGYLWHVLQHEGFHEFAFYTISPRLPIWVNEGLAEYFGEARFTGDAFISGMIPDARRKRIVDLIFTKKFTPFADFIALTPEVWQAEMSAANYDQAWSMVQFLALGEKGKYQAPFVNYMRALSRGGDPQMAWDNVFGHDTTAFEAAWEKYWTTLPENPTVDQDIRARLMTMDSFIARAQTAKHHYKTFADFWTDAQAGTFYIPTDAAHWLPKEVATLAITTASADSPTANPAPPLDPKDVTLKWNGDHPVLTEQMPDGSSLISTFSEYDDRMKTTIQTKPAPVVKAVKATGATNAEH